ncbi:MAG TPA: quinone oxidoreductase [Actinomycetaceae bacterium]|nr:quinone oxidoreductase [Actinomycetaceae bacterium]
MYAIVAQRPGNPDVLEWTEVPDASAGEGEVLVQLEAAGVNFIDTYERSGVYPSEFPLIPGLEGAGRVVAVGEGVTDVTEGQIVAWTNVPRSYAELVAVPARRTLPVPDGVPAEVAAAVPLQGMTAHYLVNSVYEVRPGTTILITAGAGGVGRIVTQLAKSKGATVIATVGRPEKTEIARAAGADHVVELSELDDPAVGIPGLVREIVPGGVDVAYDGIGKATFDGTLGSVRRRGLLVLFGGASGQVPPFDLQRLNRAGSLFVTRPTLSDYIVTREELTWRAAELFNAALEGNLDFEIGKSVALQDAAEAHRALESGESTAKVILRA